MQGLNQSSTVTRHYVQWRDWDPQPSHITFDLQFTLPRSYSGLRWHRNYGSGQWLDQLETHIQREAHLWHCLDGQDLEAGQPRDLGQNQRIIVLVLKGFRFYSEWEDVGMGRAYLFLLQWFVSVWLKCLGGGEIKGKWGGECIKLFHFRKWSRDGRSVHEVPLTSWGNKDSWRFLGEAESIFFSVVETTKLFRLQYINPQPCIYRWL